MALDVARTAARGGEQVNLQRNLSIVAALDVARSAIRFGARKVTVCSLESESEMPAAREEMEEAAREGIRFLHRVGPKRLVGEKGTVTGIEFLKVSRVFDETGRFSPQFIEGSETIFPTDTVIISIGQTGDFSFLRPEDGIETRGGRIVIDPDTLATTAPGVWAGGDAAFGPRIAINAIADGKRGTRSIDEHFRGSLRSERELAVEIDLHSRYERDLDFEGIPRQKPPTRPISRRIGIAEVEECFGEREARLEGKRCLHCWTNTIFEEDPRAGTSAFCAGAARTSARRIASRSCPSPWCKSRPPRYGSSRRFSRTEDASARSSSKTRRPASAAGSAPGAVRWARSPCRASTRRRTPLPEDPEDLTGIEEDGPSRRDFFGRVGVAACAVAAVGSGVVTLDYLKPKVLFEPPTRFRAGNPLDYPEGVVRFNKQQKAYVIGAPGGVYALSAVCTHLGCITRFLSDEKCIACPCHGSRFDLEGNVIHGPAPRPLPWLEMQVDATGTLLVDTSVTIPHGRIFKA